MKARFAVLLLPFLVLVGCKPQHRQPQPLNVSRPSIRPAAPETLPEPFLGQWAAYSSTARAITGDVALEASTLRLGTVDYSLREIVPLTQDQIIVLNSFSVVGGIPSSSFLARVQIPADLRLRGATVCGGSAVSWVAGMARGGEMGLVFFSGDPRGVLDKPILGSSHLVCGTFGYSNGGSGQ